MKGTGALLALRDLRDLIREGGLTVTSPPGAAPGTPLQAVTVVQLTGHVTSRFTRALLADPAAVEAHLQRVEAAVSQLGGHLAGLARGQHLVARAGTYLLGLTAGGGAIGGGLDLPGFWLLASGGFAGRALHWAGPRLLRLWLRSWTGSRRQPTEESEDA